MRGTARLPVVPHCGTEDRAIPKIMTDAGLYMDEAAQRKEKVVTADLIHSIQKKQKRAI
ncbi:MAG: hypothetical protein HQK83_08895 [Fibrobacteria bacterium]|nr:hypothetical protein [Fibrobacteria bacterium]